MVTDSVVGVGCSLWTVSSLCRWLYGVSYMSTSIGSSSRIRAGDIDKFIRILRPPRSSHIHTSPLAYTRRKIARHQTHAENRTRSRRTSDTLRPSPRLEQMACVGVHSLLHLLHLQREHRLVHEPLAQKPRSVHCCQDQCVPNSHAGHHDCDYAALWLDERCVAAACADCVLLAYCVFLCVCQFGCLGWCAVWAQVGVVLFDRVFFSTFRLLRESMLTSILHEQICSGKRSNVLGKTSLADAFSSLSTNESPVTDHGQRRVCRRQSRTQAHPRVDQRYRVSRSLSREYLPGRYSEDADMF